MNPKIRAQEVIASLDIRHPSEIILEDIAAYFDVLVKEERLSGAAARLVRSESAGIITVSTSIDHVGRKRFSIGHELGHYIMHDDHGSLIFCTERDMEDWSTKQKELEANIFSSELIMPTSLFKPMCKGDPGCRLVGYLANLFSSSLTATCIKYVDVDIEPCAIVCATNGKVSWSKRSKSFDYRIIPVGTKLHAESYAHDAFSGTVLPEDGDYVPTYAWLSDGRVDQDKFLKESTFHIKALGSTMTLLWIDDDIER